MLPAPAFKTARIFAAALAAAGLACAKVPHPPTAAIDAPAAAHVGIRVQLDGTKSTPASDLPDPASIPLSFRWTLAAVPSGSSASLDDAAAPRPRFVPDAAGDYVVQLVVKDFAHESAPLLATVHAAADCVPTVAAASATPAAVNVGQGTSLTGVAQAPCNGAGTGPDPIASFLWTIASAPAGSKARIVAPRQPNTTLVPDLRGTYVLTLQATDSLGFKSTAANVTLTANACGDNLPSVDSMSASIASPNVGAPVRLSAQVSDGDLQSPCTLAHSFTWAWSIASAPAGSKARLTSRSAETPSFTPDVAGDYVLALEVTDERGGRSPRGTTTVTASACGGGRPMVTATASSSAVTTGDAVQLVSSVQDSDLAAGCLLPVTFSYAWQVVAAPLSSRAQLNGTRLSNPTFRADAPGAYVFSLVVTASNGKASDPVLVPVQVDACGSVAPVASIVAPNGPATGAAFALDSVITDSNATGTCRKTVQPYAFTWTLKSAPAGSLALLSGLTSAGTSAQAMPSMTPDVDGDYTVQLSVTDALGLASAPVTKTFTVAKCNAALTAPIAAPSGGVTGQPVRLVAGTILDSNGGPACPARIDPFTYAWSIIGQPAGATAALNNAADVSPSFTPAVAGSYTVQLVVTDAAGNQSLPATATVAVSSCTAQLSGSVPDVSGPTGQPLLLTAVVTDPNESGCNGLVVKPYSYAWSFASAPAGSTAMLNNANAANPSFVPDVAGDYLVTVAVTDAAGNTSGVLPAGKAHASACNNAPSALISSVAGAATGLPVALTTTVSDTNTVANGCPAATTASFTYAWSLIGRPAGSAAALNNPAAQSPSFTPDVPGTYAVTLSVTDAGGNVSPTQTQNIVVANCTAPLTVAIPPVSGAKTLSSVALLAAVANPNTGAACPSSTATKTWAWSLAALPSGSKAALDVPVSATPAFTPDLPGTYVVALRVTDGAGNTGAATQAIQVSGCGSSFGSSMTVAAVVSPAAPEVGQDTRLSAVVTDTNSAGCSARPTAPFSYAWILRPPAGSKSVLGDQTAAQPSFVPDLALGYEYSVVVTDALGYQASASGAVLPVDCTLTPAISAVGAGQMTFSAVQLVGAATPATGSCSAPVAYAWSFDVLPAASRTRFTAPNTRTPSFTVDVPNGTWVARLTVTDTKTGAKTSTTRTVTSNSCGSLMPSAIAGISLPFPITINKTQPDPSVGSTVQYLPGYQLQLDGTGSSDPAAACTGPLTFSWSTYSRPVSSVAQLYPSTAAKPVFTPDQQGDYVFALTVSDGRFTSAPTYLRINVNDPLTDQVAVTSRGVIWNDLEAPDPRQPSVNPAIAYYELNAAGTFYDLKYVQCDSSGPTNTCATGSPKWGVPQIIEPNAVDVRNTELYTAQVSLRFLPNKQPVVAYRYDPQCQVRYAVLNGATWQKSVIENIGSGGCLGEHGEIQLMFVGASKTPAVAYHSHNGALSANYAICSGAGCSTTGVGVGWTVRIVDASGNAGHWMTAFVDPVSLRPSLAYHNDSGWDLWYTTCTANCDLGSVAFSPPVMIASTGLWNSMSQALDGTVGIAYQDDTLNRVRIATCPSASANCTSAASWSFTDIATLGVGDYFPSLQYDPASRAHVTYIDSANQTLRYAIQNPGNNTFQYFDIDHGVTDGHSSFILTPLGSTHVSYALTSGLKYYPFGD